MSEIVPEIDVLIATAIWLWQQRKVLPLKFSVARGKGININSDIKRLQEALEVARVPNILDGNNQFLSTIGPDVIGVSKTEFWQIECKGCGPVKTQTHRNNFDRALASVVSYYGNTPFDDIENRNPYLGLALPNIPVYISELRHRVRIPLRRQLNLWVLLYDLNTKLIYPITPDKEYDNK